MAIQNPRPVYLSPHLDDAVLSCGGLIHQQAQQGVQPLVITVFAGIPDYSQLSPFAAQQHQMWGELAAPIERRRCEDATALTYLGAAYQHWGYLDAIYRREAEHGEFLYTSKEALFGQVRSIECGLSDELAARLASSLLPEETILYTPLAVGHHVDHQIMSPVVTKLLSCGFSVQLYEDYPYAEKAQKLKQALQTWPQLVPMARVISAQDLAAKVNAIRSYRSQLGVLFRGESSIAERVESHALLLGGGAGYVERYWMPQ